MSGGRGGRGEFRGDPPRTDGAGAKRRGTPEAGSGGQSVDQTGSGGLASETNSRSLTYVRARTGGAASARAPEGGARDESPQWSRILWMTSRCQGLMK